MSVKVEMRYVWVKDTKNLLKIHPVDAEGNPVGFNQGQVRGDVIGELYVANNKLAGKVFKVTVEAVE